MATPAAAISIMREDTPVAVAYETFELAMNDDTSAVITPTNIKSIDHVEITPQDASATDAYLDTFSPGAATVTIASTASSTLLVTIFGRIG